MKTIFIIGYYGYGNTGDDAMLLGLNQILQDKGYESKHYCKGDGVLKTLFNILEAKYIVLGGGTHLRNWGTRRLRQSARVLSLGLVRLLGKKFYMINVGIDGVILTKLAKKSASCVTIRDKNSFDSSAAINFEPLERQKILGISLAPVYEAYYKDFASDMLLSGHLIKKVQEWLQNNDWKVRIFNFHEDDELINGHVAWLLTKHAEFLPYQSDIQLTMERISQCSAFIGMKYHACMFAYLTQTPLMVIESYPSCRQLANMIGVHATTKEQIIDNNFELKFDRAILPVKEARGLAYKGVCL
jgi:polysaccharide pyruvyl transferase WcaK-like protein